MDPLPLSWNSATVSAYYLYGIESGLFGADCAKEWAYGIVEELDNPPIEIIEVAAANHRDEAISSLAVASEFGDLPSAGAKLLSATARALQAGKLSVLEAVRIATQVAGSTLMSKDVRLEIDILEHEVADMERGVFSSVAAVSEHVVEKLSRFDVAGAI